MASTVKTHKSISDEHRRIATQNYQRATEVLNSGDYSYGIELLQTCCRVDPDNLIFRKTLRAAQFKRIEKSLVAGWVAPLTTIMPKNRLRVAHLAGNHAQVLEYGEAVLSRSPSDVRTQLAMAQAADALGLLDTAVWILEQARRNDKDDKRIYRPLARLYEKKGNYVAATALWDLIAEVDPQDSEAHKKAKDLAAVDTITKGQFEGVTQGTVDKRVIRTSAPQPGEFADPNAAQGADQVNKLAAKIAENPENTHAYLRLAKIHQDKGELQEAGKVLSQGLASTGNDFDLQMALSELEIVPFRQELRIAEKKLKSKPDDKSIEQQRFGLQKEINTREIDIYRARSDRFPTDAGPKMELGIRLLRAGQLDAAIPELQFARKNPQFRWRALLYLGQTFKKKNNWQLARRNFEEALAALPPAQEEGRKELLYQLATGAAAQKDWSVAVEMGNELANIDYGFRNIGSRLEEWEQAKSSIPSSKEG